MEALTETAERTGGPLAVHLMADHGLSVTDQVEQHELAETILDIVLAIEPRARRVWTMRFLEERTLEEIMGRPRHHPPPVRPDPSTVPPGGQPKLCASLAGDWCPGHAPRFGRLAAATAEQAEQAQQHLSACPACPHAYETSTRLHPSP